ncbi:primase-helicase family protein [Massilia haematophila]|uniref:Primase-helicase family protein n=1 Tax=Massilia haematophila TaxID=457923 RepID=A0ABV7PKN3_9BURK
MTQLALVSSNTVEAAPAAPLEEYTESERKLISDYQAALEVGRYFKFHNAASPVTRLISGDDPTQPLPLSFLVDDFVDFCREQGRRPPRKLPSVGYLAYNLQTVTGTIFKPKGTPLVRAKQSRHRYVNTFKAFEPARPALPLSRHFHALMEGMFPDAVERHTFQQYVAHMMQCPEIRPSWHPMLLSETGTGKGFLFESILTPLLCGQTSLLKKYSELTGRFANVMRDCILIQLDDCKSKRADVQTQLKSLMSEERVLLEQKNQAAGMVVTYARFFLASNEEVPLEIDDTERRWWIPKRLGYSNGLTGDDGRKQRKREVIQPLADWLKLDGALEAVHAYFMAYDLEHFDAKTPPMTATLHEQIAKSVTVEQSFALDFLADHQTKVVKSEELSKAFLEASLTKPGYQLISQLFADAGYRSESLTVAGKKTRWWIPAAMTKAEAEAIATAQLPIIDPDYPF